MFIDTNLISLPKVMRNGLIYRFILPKINLQFLELESKALAELMKYSIGKIWIALKS